MMTTPATTPLREVSCSWHRAYMQINSDKKLEGSSLDHDEEGHPTAEANMDVGVDTGNNVTKAERRL